jgi:hypothetical protein
MDTPARARVGGRNKWAVVTVPQCECGSNAQVSRSRNGTTKHSCITCYTKPSKHAQVEALLRSMGITPA